ncbi:PilZ domain-containing protein [Devosia sp. 1566]|uniref:PilZ domain-containing protein n=1 Tax=Devosia sp. 1566 TaxID=2499144 RepID=UPI000FD73CC3|nr:PilZ domain-containing protein [Devosia sp. 1566]
MASQNDRRAVPRTETRLAVTIVHGGGVAREDGDVHNISTMGAKIAVQAAQALPEIFYLLMPGHRLEVCKVVWRNDNEMGVAFQAYG